MKTLIKIILAVFFVSFLLSIGLGIAGAALGITFGAIGTVFGILGGIVGAVFGILGRLIGFAFNLLFSSLPGLLILGAVVFFLYRQFHRPSV